MYTECPSCNTFFRISQDHLDTAGGKVRCGSCNTIFDARDHLFDELPTTTTSRQASDEPFGETRQAQPQREEFAGSDSAGASDDESDGFEIAPDEEPLDDLFDADDEAIAKDLDLADMDETFDEARLDDEVNYSHSVDGETQSQLDDFGDAEDIVDEVQGEHRRSFGWIGTAVWGVLIIGFVAVLIGQYAYFQRADLAKDPSLRPWLEKMCGVVSQYAPCDVPEPQDVSAIKLKGEVRSDPETPNTLLISAVMVNEAPFDQPFPLMVLRFSDINQKLVARSRFSPQEYLGKGVDIKSGIKRGESVTLTLKIKDPGKEAVNFNFEVE